MKKPVKELPSQAELLKLFYYDNGLRWGVDIRTRGRRVNTGDIVVGCKNNHGYRQITVNGKSYRLSRIIYQTVYGSLTPDLVIDHINRDRDDDRIENLRATSQKCNNRNYSKYSTNTTGFTGVFLQINKRVTKSNRVLEYQAYVAHWCDISGKLKRKSFSISKYGIERAFEMACDHRRMMIKSLIEQGHWYGETHGV